MSKRRTMKRVLITENVEVAENMLRNAFGALGEEYVVSYVSSGEACLEYLQQSDNYDLCFVLLDMQVPGVVESNLLTRLSTEEAFRTIPVIVFTAYTTKEQVLNCYNEGANAFVVRPDTAEEYNRVIATITDFWGNVNVLAKPEAVVEF